MKALDFLKSKIEIPENKLVDQLHKYLSKYFLVYREITSECGTSRIDMLLYHKSDFSKNHPLGIEVKTANKKRGKNISEWLKQAVRYTDCIFDNNKLLVFTFPQISGIYFDEGILMNKHDVFSHHSMEGSHHNFSTFLGCYDIGELQAYDSKNKIQLRLVHKSKLIWNSEKDTMNYEYYDNYISKHSRS